MKKFTVDIRHQALHRKWHNRTGIRYTLVIDVKDDGTRGTTINHKTGLCPKCSETVTKLEYIMVNPREENAHTRSSTAKFQTTKNT